MNRREARRSIEEGVEILRVVWTDCGWSLKAKFGWFHEQN